MTMGHAIAQAAHDSGLFVSYYPDYGPEQRGGTSNCSVVISGRAVGSPVVDHPDVLVALNRPSLMRFASTVRMGGTILHDSLAGEFSVPGGRSALAIPATTTATEMGRSHAANMVMLGALVEYRRSGPSHRRLWGPLGGERHEQTGASYHRQLGSHGSRGESG